MGAEVMLLRVQEKKLLPFATLPLKHGTQHQAPKPFKPYAHQVNIEELIVFLDTSNE